MKTTVRLLEVLAADESTSAPTLSSGRKAWALRDGENIILDIPSNTGLDQTCRGLRQACRVLCFYDYRRVWPLASRMHDQGRMVPAAISSAIISPNHNAYATVLQKGHWDWENAERVQASHSPQPDYKPAHWGYSNCWQ